MTTSSATLGLEHICSIEDIFQRHLLPYLTATSLGRLECTSPTVRHQIKVSFGWKILCQRDYYVEHEEDTAVCRAPVYNTDLQSFDELKPCLNWKESYKHWLGWQAWTHSSVKPQDMVKAMNLFRRLRVWLRHNNLQNVLQSFAPCLEQHVFERLKGHFPSNLLALYAIHGGQNRLRPTSPDSDFFAGLFGGYTCYDSFYSMRLMYANMFADEDMMLEENNIVPIAMSPGNPRTYLFVNPTPDDPEGSIMISNSYGTAAQLQTVGRGGILSYLETYVDRLEGGYYQPIPIIPGSPTSTGISLFPNAGPTLSCAVTRGIEVRASARWFPDPHGRRQNLNFGYSIRIRLVEIVHGNQDLETTCQLVGRHWAFTDGNGDVRRVDGEGVVGKQPLFFREDNDGSNACGFVDLGPAGDGERKAGSVFYYQSQSGPVAGTSVDDTQGASVEGTFSFVPGSIENPRGPMFHVTVPKFPLSISLPFY